MWYIAVVMMAQPKQRGRRRYLCESCNVLLTAPDAQEAYRKAIAWGINYQEESIYGLDFLGITTLSEIGETIGDGVDISGRVFQKLDVWKRRKKIIPPPEELSALRWELNQDIPLEDLLPSHQLALMRQGFRSGAEQQNEAQRTRDQH